jgi:hypothetical protein
LDGSTIDFVVEFWEIETGNQAMVDQSNSTVGRAGSFGIAVLTREMKHTKDTLSP